MRLLAIPLYHERASVSKAESQPSFWVGARGMGRRRAFFQKTRNFSTNPGIRDIVVADGRLRRSGRSEEKNERNFFLPLISHNPLKSPESEGQSGVKKRQKTVLRRLKTAPKAGPKAPIRRRGARLKPKRDDGASGAPEPGASRPARMRELRLLIPILSTRDLSKPHSRHGRACPGHPRLGRRALFSEDKFNSRRKSRADDCCAIALRWPGQARP